MSRAHWAATALEKNKAEAVKKQEELMRQAAEALEREQLLSAGDLVFAWPFTAFHGVVHVLRASAPSMTPSSVGCAGW